HTRNPPGLFADIPAVQAILAKRTEKCQENIRVSHSQTMRVVAAYWVSDVNKNRVSPGCMLPKRPIFGLFWFSEAKERTTMLKPGSDLR
ncbi:MAG: hypothetical protein ACC619_04575, partial [Paracoccaceae bacterium]